MEMSKKELIAFIRESIRETNLASRLSAEDETRDEVDFENSLGAGSEDYYGDDINLGLEPLQGGNKSYDDEFSDLNGYQEFGSDYQVNPQDLPSVFSEEELARMIREGVERLHRQSIIKNRIQQINEQLESFNKESSNKKISLEKLFTLAKNAGDIVKDAESELNNLGVIYGEHGIPLSKILEVLFQYDIEFKDINKKKSSRTRKVDVNRRYDE